MYIVKLILSLYIYTFCIDLCSGIETTHPDFGGRASWGVDLVQSQYARYQTDENGHGTHVTGQLPSLKLILQPIKCMTMC